MVQIIFLSNFFMQPGCDGENKATAVCFSKTCFSCWIIFFVANQWLVLLTFVTVAK